MQSSMSKCPSCGCTNMKFGKHHGMEHNVCVSCGTVFECEQFIVDLYQQGCSEVKAEYDGKPVNYGFSGGTNNRKTRCQRNALLSLRRLMDGLNLPTSVRNFATEYFGYTNRLNRIASGGAAVYLAMKDFNMPVTIRFIANYLQISHYTIGRIMRKLEKRLGNRRTGSTAFELDVLVPHIFSQAKIGVEEERKRMLDLMLKKTVELLHLLQECLATTGYEPHLITLAAGYIVWKYLNVSNWSELNMEREKLPNRRVNSLTVGLFLYETGIKLSSLGPVTSKINLIKKLLLKLSEQIPWLSINEPSDVILHLNDFLKYKSQIIDMTARDLTETGETDPNKQTLILKTEEENIIDVVNNFEDTLQSSNSPVSSLPEGDRLASSSVDCNESDSNKRGDKLSSGNITFTRVKDLRSALQKSPNIEDESSNTKRKNGNSSNDKIESNGYNKLLRITHPQIGIKKKRKRSQHTDYENPQLSFP